MNANELADWLDNTTDSEDWGELAKYYKWCKENVAPMLRQQQAEIEALKERLAFLEDEAVMVDNSEAEYKFQFLYGEDMLAAQKRINNMLRKMVDELPTKDKP